MDRPGATGDIRFETKRRQRAWKSARRIVTLRDIRSVVLLVFRRSTDLPLGALQWGDMNGSLAANTKQFPIALRRGEFIVEYRVHHGSFWTKLQVTTSRGKPGGPFLTMLRPIYEYPPTQQQPQRGLRGFMAEVPWSTPRHSHAPRQSTSKSARVEGGGLVWPPVCHRCERFVSISTPRPISSDSTQTRHDRHRE